MLSKLSLPLAAGAMLALLAACGGGGDSAPVKPPVIFVDTDKDGTADSEDVAPNDPLCAAQSDASNGQCYLKTLAASRLKVIGNANGKIFFSAEDDGLRLYSYDVKTRHFLGRVSISNFTPVAYAYVPDHGKLYVADSNRNIRGYSESLQEDARIFATPDALTSLSPAGKFLMVQGAANTWTTHSLYDRQGVLTDKKDWSYYSRNFEWNAAQSRIYYTSEGISPADLYYDEVDQATGKLKTKGETPYHGAYSIRAPIVADLSGSKILLGSGDVYLAPTLTWGGNIGKSFNQAAWLANGHLLTFGTVGTSTRLTRFDGNRRALEEQDLKGEVLGVSVSEAATFIILRQESQLSITSYMPSDDSDGDGVPNLQDKFPLDKTAAVDSDNDGHPDAFLNAYTSADSPTGLTRDFYPFDAACHSLEQGDGTTCNYGQVLPAFVPDQVLSDTQGTVYMLHRSTSRIYRWSPAKNDYIAPLVVGLSTSSGNIAPLRIAHSPVHSRLYLGYANGAITYVSLEGDSRETAFTALGGEIQGLAAAGNFVLAQDPTGAWASHYVFDKRGFLTDAQEWNYFSRWYEWNPVQSRLYFFRDDTSPNDLHYEEIDQVTGKISAKGETTYHGDYRIAGPIRVSPNGGSILLGSGDIYSPIDLKVVKQLGVQFLDAQWRNDGSFVVMMASGAATRVVWYSTDFKIISDRLYTGAPKALLRSGSNVILVHQRGDKPTFTVVLP